MISPTEVAKRVGVGGRLVAFFKAVCVYFALGGGAGGAGDGGAKLPTAVAVAAKVAPVLCLLLLLLLPTAHKTHHTPQQSRYARLVSLGLALSAVGDALLVWPQHFVPGMGAFAGAQLAYTTAFGWGVSAPLCGCAVYAATACYLRLLSPPAGALRLLVPLYALLLATMCWRAVAARRTGGAPLVSGRSAAAAGALFFLLSDALLGYGLFGGIVPYQQVCVMSTYYVAQLGIALSALDPPSSKSHLVAAAKSS